MAIIILICLIYHKGYALKKHFLVVCIVEIEYLAVHIMCVKKLLIILAYFVATNHENKRKLPHYMETEVLVNYLKAKFNISDQFCDTQKNNILIINRNLGMNRNISNAFELKMALTQIPHGNVIIRDFKKNAGFKTNADCALHRYNDRCPWCRTGMVRKIFNSY